MNNLLAPNPKPTELSSQDGQAKLVTNEPTTQEMEIWNKDKLLLWIQEKKPELFEDEVLETFKAARISGKAFLNHAGDLGFFKECNLPMGTSWDLADLAKETKKRDSEQAGLQEPSDTTPKNRRLGSRKEASQSRSSKLVVSGKLEKFPLSRSNFSKIRRQSGVAYFDKTEYIAELENGTDVQLLCRPRRFGKTLTVTMLRCFHGFQFRNQYDQLFKGLDVDKAVKSGVVQPGQYLILQFDFSRVARPHNMDESTEFLKREINRGLSEFTLEYTEVLGGESFASAISGFIQNDPAGNLTDLVNAVDRVLRGVQKKGKNDDPLWGIQGIYLLADEYDAYANEYMDPHDPRSWSDSEPFNVLKAFWSTVKAGGASDYGIKKVYITGVTPLLLSDLISGANDQENISFSPRVSTICGLTRADVLEALRVICGDEEEVQKHFKELQHHTNGYHFCQQRCVEPVFNTQTALSYLEAVNRGEKPEAEDPSNSEVSELFLRACAGAPAAMNDMQLALRKDEHCSYQKIPCDRVLRGFTLAQLATQAAGEGDISSWRSLMVHMGGLTFDSDNPSNFLKIPNLVAAKRFGSALLDRHGLFYSMKDALYTLAGTGNPMDVLIGYCHLMRQRDVTRSAFRKNEEHHRDSIWITILENPAIKPVAEYQVKKWTNGKGFVDLLITGNKNLYTVIEFKNIQIPYLGLTGEVDNDKAEQLKAMGLYQILELNFKGDKFRSGTIHNWIDGEKSNDEISGSVRKQLQSYILGCTVQKEIAGKNFRAFAVVIVGSRQILVREMDRRGDWVNEFQLAGS